MLILQQDLDASLLQVCCKFDASSNDFQTIECANHACLNGLVGFYQTIKFPTRKLQVLLDCNLLALTLRWLYADFKCKFSVFPVLNCNKNKKCNFVVLKLQKTAFLQNEFNFLAVKILTPLISRFLVELFFYLHKFYLFRGVRKMVYL